MSWRQRAQGIIVLLVAISMSEDRCDALVDLLGRTLLTAHPDLDAYWIAPSLVGGKKRVADIALDNTTAGKLRCPS